MCDYRIRGSSALEVTALFLRDNRTIFFLYNKQNNTWMLENSRVEQDISLVRFAHS